MIASISAIAVAKHLYGGLGFNPFNPAMVGRAFVMINFAAALAEPAYTDASVGIDAITSGGRERTTFTVVAYPWEPNPGKLSTFAIREDLVLREWKEGYGEFEDATTWKAID